MAIDMVFGIIVHPLSSKRLHFSSKYNLSVDVTHFCFIIYLIVVRNHTYKIEKTPIVRVIKTRGKIITIWLSLQCSINNIRRQTIKIVIYMIPAMSMIAIGFGIFILKILYHIFIQSQEFTGTYAYVNIVFPPSLLYVLNFALGWVFLMSSIQI
jgi:hypothetical protein